MTANTTALQSPPDLHAATAGAPPGGWQDTEMQQRVNGIGGIFIKARDPDLLSQWYRTHLGVDSPPESYDVPSWWQEAGPTVLAAMPADSAHFGGPAQSWSINFRVADLDAMVEQLRGAGIAVEVDPETYPNGRFAALTDPEGNPLQLWQPDGADKRGPGGAAPTTSSGADD